MFVFCNKNKGFSLIEVAILLVIVGLFAVPLAQAYHIWIKQKQYGTTEERQIEIFKAINHFVNENGRYPVPASLVAVEGDAAYGAEGNPSPLACTDPGWEASDGLCRTDTANGPVLIGAVPFQALRLNASSSIDKWHNRFLYAVSGNQADSSLYSSVDTAGAITVRSYSESHAPTIDVTHGTTYDAILVSHGATGMGAYTVAGVQPVPCTAGRVESENCNLTETFILHVHPGNSLVKTRATSDTPRFYDDMTRAQDSPPNDQWYRHDPSTTHATTRATRIGINTNNPEARVDVHGNIRADIAIISDAVCGTDGIDCFNPRIIAGTQPEMDCNQNSLPGAEPVLRIANSRVWCGSPVNNSGTVLDGDAFQFTTFIPKNCLATGELMIGIDASGQPICAVP